MGTQTPPIFYPFMEKLPTPTKTPQQKQGGEIEIIIVYGKLGKMWGGEIEINIAYGKLG